MSVSAINNISQPIPSAARPVAAKSAEPTDTFVRVPSSMTMQDLRKVAQMSLQAAAHKTTVIDPKTIPFGVELEMEHFDANQAKPLITSQDAWTVHPKISRWKVVPDLSLSSKTGGEAVSPPMTLESGVAEKQIRATLGEMVRLGGKMTRDCGLHIHVDAKCLSEKGLANLMMIALENEHALFRYSQNGYPEHRGTLAGHGFRHNTPYHYGKPLGPKLGEAFDIKHAGSPNEFRNALFGAIEPDAFYQNLIKRGEAHARPALPAVNSTEEFHPDHKDSVRYYGINFNAYWYQGTIEFRLFEATADPDKVMENVNLVLGMVAAAARDDYAYLKSNPLNTQANPPVSKEAFEYLLGKVAPTPALQERMRKNFLSSGGTVKEDPPVTDPGVLQTAFLMEGGSKFNVDGKAVHSPLEVNDLVRGGKHKVSVTDAQGKTRNIANAADLEAIAADLETTTNRDRIARLTPADRDIFSSANQLIDRGYQFSSAAQTPFRKGSLDLLNATALKPGELTVRVPNSSLTARLPDRAALEQLAAVELGQKDKISGDTRTRLDAIDALTSKGYKFFGPDTKEEIKARVATLLLPLDMMYIQTPSGSGYKFRATPEVMAALGHHAAGRTAEMPATIVAGLDRATQLHQHNFTLEGSAAQVGPDLVATLASGQPISWTDPIGAKHQATGADGFVAETDRQLAALQVPPEHKAAFDRVSTMIGNGESVAWSTNATPPVVDVNRMTWLLGNNLNLNVEGAAELKASNNVPSAAWSVPVQGWQGLTDFVKTESAPTDVLHQSEKLALINGMRKLGAQFHYVTPSATGAKNHGTPISLNGSILNHFDQAGVQVRLPKTIFWAGLPRKTITIRANEVDLAIAASRIGYHGTPAAEPQVAVATEEPKAVENAPVQPAIEPLAPAAPPATTDASAEQPAAPVAAKKKGFLGLW